MFRRLVVASVAMLLCSCVGPARSFGAYEGKAGATAADMLSSVETVRLAVVAVSRGRMPAAPMSVVVTDAEKDAASIQGTFDSIQPPDAASDRLRTDLDELLAASVSTISMVRIAARRGELARLPQVAEPLDELGSKLAGFAEDHQ